MKNVKVMLDTAKIISWDKKKGHYYVKFGNALCPFSTLNCREVIECNHPYSPFRCKYFVKHKWHEHEFCIICSHPPRHQPTEQYLF